MPKAFNSCPKSNKSPDLVTLIVTLEMYFQVFSSQYSSRNIIYERRILTIFINIELVLLILTTDLLVWPNQSNERSAK